MLTFSVLDRKHPFGTDLVQKGKIICLICNLTSKFKYVKFNGDVHLSCLGLETPFLGNFCTKSKKCCSKLKF